MIFHSAPLIPKHPPVSIVFVARQELSTSPESFPDQENHHTLKKRAASSAHPSLKPHIFYPPVSIRLHSILPSHPVKCSSPQKKDLPPSFHPTSLLRKALKVSSFSFLQEQLVLTSPLPHSTRPLFYSHRSCIAPILCASRAPRPPRRSRAHHHLRQQPSLEDG